MSFYVLGVDGSQPPFLSRMVRAIFSETGDLSLATKALPLLLQEYQFWTTGEKFDLNVSNNLGPSLKDKEESGYY